MQFQKPNFSVLLHKLSVIAIHMIKMAIASSQWGLFNDIYFLLNCWTILKLHADYCCYIQISIELKVKCARRVLNWFSWSKAYLKKNFLSYLVILVCLFFCLFVCMSIHCKVIAAFIWLGWSSRIIIYSQRAIWSHATQQQAQWCSSYRPWSHVSTLYSAINASTILWLDCTQGCRKLFRGW